MAYETEYANIVKPTDVLAVGAAKAFISEAFYLSTLRQPSIESLPVGTKTKLFRKRGYLVAETVAESGSITPSANNEITETSTSVTAEKQAVAVFPTVENLKFTEADLAAYGAESGQALARLSDSQLKALHSSFTNSVTATSILTVDDILDAAYTVRSSIKGGASGARLVGVFDYKGINEINKELKDAGGSAYVQQINLELLGTTNGEPLSQYKGNLMGVDIYETDGLPTSGGDDIALVFDPGLAYAAIVEGGLGINSTIDKPKATAGFKYEISSWAFWKVQLWNDTAACKVLSDT